MIDHLAIYDVIYGLAAGDGREAQLFGDTAPLAREAFERSLIGDEFPLIWFEIPFAGTPRFDLHVALSRTALVSGAKFLPGAGNGYDRLFDWYSRDEAGGGGLAFAYDVGDGRIEDPAVHVNVNNAPLEDMGRFFELASGDEAAALYRSFEAGLPEGWRVWYSGVHPGRPGSPIRVDCFVDGALQAAYANDVSLLERDLRSCGFSASLDGLPGLVAPILESPYGLELQFDVMRDGTLGPTVGLSAGFRSQRPQAMRAAFDDGAAAEFMGKVERMGLADERWRHISGATFGKLIGLEDANLAIYCVPTFVKLRLRDGRALDAKAYLQAGAATL